MGLRLLGLAAALFLAACSREDARLLPHKRVEVSPFLGDTILGDKAAPVEIVEYASTTCGHCYAFHIQMLPALKEKYIDTGKARLHYIVLPTVPAELAIAGGAIARCAGQDKFFEVIEDLFQHQDALIEAARNPRKLQQGLNQVGSRHGLDADEVGACIADPRVSDAIISRARARPDFITGTPGFIVGGEHVQEPTLDSLSAAIEAKLPPASGR